MVRSTYSESLINVVSHDEPKMLKSVDSKTGKGLDQKVSGQAQVFPFHLTQTVSHRQIGETQPT
ncbi:MAG TPA: hypothetical protein VJX67_11430 [Blastocatellia bacterium]|nr:hypothetical protein [Blastocatellia bacterium]